DPRGDPHGELAGPPHAPRSVTRMARVFDDAPAPSAPRTRLCELERALVDGDLTRPAALRTRHGRRSRLGARPTTRLARRGAADLHRDRGAMHGVVERDVNLCLEIAPACGLGASPAASAAATEA